MKKSFLPLLIIVLAPLTPCWADTFVHIDGTGNPYGYVAENKEHRLSNVLVDIVDTTGLPTRLRLEADDWDFWFATPEGDFLTVDNYEYAFYSQHNRHGYPSMTLSAGSRACWGIGRFVVHEFEYEADTVTKLAIDFEFTCDNVYSEEKITGEIRFNSTLPEVLDRPNAAAGRDQLVDEGWPVQLDGSFTSRGISAISGYQWTQISGTPVLLVNSTSAHPAFTAPPVNPGGDFLVFELLVTDAAGNTDTDRMTVKVMDIDDPHTFIYFQDSSFERPSVSEHYIAADDVRFLLRQDSSHLMSVILNGHIPLTNMSLSFGSTHGSTIGTGYYVDTGRSGEHPISKPSMRGGEPLCNLFNNTVGRPGRFFVHELEYDDLGKPVKLAVDYIEYCGITTNIRKGAIRVNSSYPLARREPYSVAGPDQKVFEGAGVVLNGSHSDSGSDILLGNSDKIVSYRWRQLDGPTVVISDEQAAITNFIAPSVTTEQTLVFELTVTDRENLSNIDLVAIKVMPTDISRTFIAVTGHNNHNQFPADRGGLFIPYENIPLTFETLFQNVNINSSRILLKSRDLDFWLFTFNLPHSWPSSGDYFSGSGVVDISFGTGVACSTQTGEVNFLNFTLDDQLGIQSASIDFSHECRMNIQDPVNRVEGKVRINQVHDGYPPFAGAVPDIVVYEGEQYLLDASASTDDKKVIGYSWQQLTGQNEGLRYSLERARKIIPVTASPLRLGVDQEERLFQLTIFDSDGFTSEDVVKVLVNRKNQVPVVNDDTATTTTGKTITIIVTNNDFDSDGQITHLGFGKARYGDVIFTGSSESLDYEPPQGFTGIDQFTYYAIDNFGAYSAFATVTVTVTDPVEPKPAPKPAPSPDSSPDNQGGNFGGNSGGGGGSISLPGLAFMFMIYIVALSIRDRKRPF